MDQGVHQEGRTTNHILVGVAASLGLALVLIVAISLTMLLLLQPAAFGILTVLVGFGVIIGIIDWYTERHHGNG